MTLRERIARSICRIEEPDHDPGADDGGREPPLWTHYTDHADAAINEMSIHPPMDEIADLLDKWGINSPRPSDVLRAFFDIAKKGAPK